MNAGLAHPWILIALPVALGLCLWVLHRSLVDSPRGLRVLQLALRGLLIAALLLAIAVPVAERAPRGQAVIALLDRSASMDEEAQAAALRHLEAARAHRGDEDRLSIVAFARAARRLPLADDAPASTPIPLSAPSALDGEASDLEAALRLATGLFPPDRAPRIVLYSDGNETQGRARDLIPELAARRIPVDVVTARASERPEILVRTLSLPEEVRPSARFEVTAEIVTTVAQRAVVSLYRDEFVNPLDGRRELDLPAGRTVVRWKSEVPDPGLARYSVRLSGSLADRVVENNRADAVTIARGNPRVLLAEGGGGSPELAAAMAKEHIDVEVRGPSGLPTDPAALAAFDLVALSDVAAPQVSAAQAAAIERYVEGGGGFLFLGGENATEGWTGSRIEKILPVRFDKERRKEEAQLALALTIDRSGSMEAESRLELAKEAAKATAELLGPEDLITVIAFDSVASPIVRLQRAANRLRITTDIARLRPGGGTAILPALREAFTALDSAHAKVKHVILLTDGQASYDGIPELVREMVEHRITVSAVGVGGEADRSLLTTIAQKGQGRFYFTRDADQVPKIFLKETSEVAKRSLVEDPTSVRIARSAELFAGIPVEAAPPLTGYVSLRPKPGGEVLLVSGRGDPLLARRRDGLGQTAVWASDAKNRWASAWLRWPGYSRFFAQLVRSTMRPPLSGAGTFPVEVELDPPSARVTIDATGSDDRFVSGLEGWAELVEPNDARAAARPDERAPLTEIAPGRYRAELPIDRPGARLLRTSLRRDGSEVSRSLQAVTLPRSREHLALGPDQALLGALAQGTSGRVDPAPTAVFGVPIDPQARHSRQPLWPYALWAALVLLVVDLAARRIPGRA